MSDNSEMVMSPCHSVSYCVFLFLHNAGLAFHLVRSSMSSFVNYIFSSPAINLSGTV